jgi:hypothetical protein
VAHGENHCQWRWDEECLARTSRTYKSEESMGGTCSASSNRLVRTRMLGGVGRMVSDGHPYPISSFLIAK